MNVITLQGHRRIVRYRRAAAADADVNGVVSHPRPRRLLRRRRPEPPGVAWPAHFGARQDQGEEQAAAAFLKESRKLSLLYRRIETSASPLAAALTGNRVVRRLSSFLRSSFHYRLRAEPETRLGLPALSRIVPGRRRNHPHLTRCWPRSTLCQFSDSKRSQLPSSAQEMR